MSTASILVVEDNNANSELARDLLEVAGYTVIDAETGGEGIAMAREHRPDLILMDIGLPDMDGLEAVARLRQDDATSTIPIVATTSHAMKDDEKRILQGGCDGYIPKPIDTRTFVSSVVAHLEK